MCCIGILYALNRELEKYRRNLHTVLCAEVTCACALNHKLMKTISSSKLASTQLCFEDTCAYALNHKLRKISSKLASTKLCSEITCTYVLKRKLRRIIRRSLHPLDSALETTCMTVCAES